MALDVSEELGITPEDLGFVQVCDGGGSGGGEALQDFGAMCLRCGETQGREESGAPGKMRACKGCSVVGFGNTGMAV